MAGFTVNGNHHIKQNLLDMGVSPDTRLFKIETDLFVPGSANITTRFRHPKKYYQVGQITAYYDGFVVYHSYLEFEKQFHDTFLTHVENVMPIFMYLDTYFSASVQIGQDGIPIPKLGQPPKAGPFISAHPNTLFNTISESSPWKFKLFLFVLEAIFKILTGGGLGLIWDALEMLPEDNKERWVIETKPCLMGWLKAVDEIEIEVFESDCSCTLIVEELR